MAYISDDPKPIRPNTSSSSKKDVALENCAGVRASEETLNARHVEDVVGHNCSNCDSSDEQSVADQQDKSTVEVDSPGSAQQRNGTVCATRAGDDDIRPDRPTEDVLKRRVKPMVHPRNPSPDSAVSSKENRREDVDASEKFGLLKLIAYACSAIAVIWLLGSFGTVLHSIAVAESIPEMLLFCLIFVIEVSVVWYVIHYAKNEYIRLFPARDRYAELSGFKDDAAALYLLSRLRDHKYADFNGFMDEYSQFQLALDKQALEVIKHYAKIIGIKTAASPWKVVDIIAVFFNSTLMVSKIAKVYHRRVSRQQAFRLVIHWFINLYISGELGQVTEGAADAIARGASEWLGEEGISSVLQTAAPLLAKFGGKLAEGGINAYLAYRLGSRACEHFRELVD